MKNSVLGATFLLVVTLFSSTQPAHAASVNLVPNQSVETSSLALTGRPDDWTNNIWGANTAQFSYLDTGHNSNRSIKTEITTYTAGDAKWSFTPQPIAAGKTYQFIDYYKSNAVTEIQAMILMRDGTKRYISVGQPAPATDWARFAGHFTAPADAASVTILHLLKSVGWLITDDFSLAEFTPRGFERGLVSLTFDDSWRSQYENALPLLKKYRLLSTQYVLTGYTTHPTHMTVDMMRTFHNAGHEVASHTMTHSHLPQISNLLLWQELGISKKLLYEWFDVPASSFASPHGEYNANTLAVIKQLYRSHRGTNVGFNSRESFDKYNIRIQTIRNTTQLTEVSSWIKQAQTDRTWLVLMYHQVDTSGGIYAITPAILEAQLVKIKESRIAVKTVAQALRELTPQLPR